LKILEIINKKNIISNYNVHIFYQDHVDGKVLKNILEDIKSSQEKLIMIILQKNSSKIEIYTLVTKDCFDVVTAKDIINKLKECIGSIGGGRDDIAQAGFEFDGKINDLISNIQNIISEFIKKKEK
jgi:alanyl-tRNA synthetase